MSSADARAPRRGDLTLAIGCLVALLVTVLPLLRVVAPGPWLAGTVALMTALLATGFVARRLRLPAIAVSLAEAAVWIVVMTTAFLSGTALLGIIPTVATVQAVPGLIDAAMTEIYHGIAPMAATAPLAFLIVGATGLLTIAVDHVVITARMPLLAAVALVMVSLIPAIAVPVEPDILAFVLLAACILFLVRAETQSRTPGPARRERGADATPPLAGVTATAAGIGVVAVVVALVITPALPQPVLRAGSNPFGTGVGLDASLELGDDLRRPREIEIMRVHSSAPTPPYLRATTLSDFDGEVWMPDVSRSIPLDAPNEFGDVSVDEDIRVDEYVTTVEVENLSSTWLPVSFPAVQVDGLAGQWAAVPWNRTVIARAGSSQGETYQVTTHVPRPTLEQIRLADARWPGLPNDTTAVPAGVPAVVGALAREVTADAFTDYDRLEALQSWFRGADFRYSLSAPVDEGFDGSGAEAIAQFLEVREGYCIHFASAFALMARTLDMPSRIVVGFLPGSSTTEVIDGETVHSITTSRTHAWPEVYFDGIGWVAFEPTNSLGSPTAFSAAPTDPLTGDPAVTPSTPANASPTPTAGQDPRDVGQDETGAASGPLTATGTGWPPAAIVLLIAALLALPAVAREVRRRSQLAQAGDGDAAAAWTLVQDAAIDLGIPVPPSETPRALGERLVARHGAPAEQMGRLVDAIERAAYAPSRAQYWEGDTLPDAVRTVRAAMMAQVPLTQRVLAILAPRSLAIRPGTAYAAAAQRRR
ncbi:DUF3488 and transglutaminase-like domain-containing protein [Microbacter sp. GSS18]|nr:DUF3488 and transglutaminase-like domain-containing protein [Microbacter sp. GSS18]